MKEYVFCVKLQSEVTTDGDVMKDMIRAAFDFTTPDIDVREVTLVQIRDTDPREEG